MEKLKTVICILGLTLIWSCNNNLENKNRGDIDISNHKQPSRFVIPKTDEERKSNLLIDCYNYSKSVIEMNPETQIELFKTEFIEQFGGKQALMEALENYYNRLKNSADTISTIKIAICDTCFTNKPFYNNDSIYYALINLRSIKTKDKGRVEMSYDKKLIAESVDNGVMWRFVELRAIKDFDGKKMFSMEDYKIISYLLE